MIGQLNGILLEKQPPQILLNVAGVGYEIEAPMSTFYHLPEVGANLILHTHLVVREDAHQLFGFYTKEERALFRTLLKVNGVGPKLALTILSSVPPQEFIRCVIEKDTDSLTRVPGVGKKTAERLLIEMRDKVANLPSSQQIHLQSTSRKESLPQQQNTNDAVAALIALGYKPQEASRAVSKIDEPSLTSEEIIRRALREMV